MSELPDRHAAVIGIDAYGHAPLRSAVKDACEIARALKDDHHYSAVHLLLNKDATRDGILHLLEEILTDGLGPNSGVVIYYAGHGHAEEDEHGSPHGFLLPQDARLNDDGTFDEDTLLSMSRIRQALGLDPEAPEKKDKFPCRHLLVVLDCCYAGSFRWASTRSMVPTGRPLYESQYNRYLLGTAWQVLTLAAHDEEAIDLVRDNRGEEEGDSPFAGHSPFAAALLRGLAGDADSSRRRHDADGVMTATELHQYIFEELVRPVEHWPQTPGVWPLKPDNTGEFIFLSPAQEEVRTVADPPLDEANNPWPGFRSDDNNPWLGFRSYDESDAPLFFGRERVIGELLERLPDPSRPLLAVVGTSGSGKSSVVRAGLLPRLKQPPEELRETVGAWTVITAASLRVDPLGQLDEAEDGLAEAPEGHRKLLFVDSFEDLFLAGHDATVQDGFLDRLRALMTGADPVRVLLTLRSGFETRLKEALEDLLAPASGDLQAPGPYKMPAPTLDELREIVEQPAAVKALYFEPGELVDELIEEVLALPGALPLLSLTLAQMYSKYLERRQAWGSLDRALNRQDHKAVGGPEGALGGVAGAVHAFADQLLEKAGSEGLAATFRRVALRMVSFKGWGGASRRPVCRRELEYADPQEQERVGRVLDMLTQAHLLVVDRERMEPVHDTLVREWPEMKSWLHEFGDDQQLLRAVWEAAEEWENGRRAEGLLWDDHPRLPEVQEPEMFAELNRLEREFVDASVRRLRSEKEKARKTRDERRVAVAGMFNGIDPTRAALVLLEVENPDETPGVVAGMLDALAQPLAHSILWHEAPVVGAAMNADGTRVLTTSKDGTARVWNVGTRSADGPEGRTLGEPVVHRGHQHYELKSAAFHPDGSKVLTVGGDGTARVWNADGSGREVVLGHRVENAAWSADGTRVAFTEEKKLWLWNADGSGKPVALGEQEGWLRSVAWSADGTKIVTAGSDKTARVWNVGPRPADGSDGRTPGEPVVLDHGSEQVHSAVFNAKGTKILTVGHYAFVWNADASGKPVVLKSKYWHVSNAAFNADGNKVVTACTDGAVRVWSLRSNGQPPGKPLVLRHDDWVASAAWSADGTRVLTASWDGIARVWKANEPGPPLLLRGHQGRVESAAWSADGTRVLTASADGTARMWKVGGPEGWTPSVPIVLEGHEEKVLDAAFNGDGTKVLITVLGHGAWVWNADGSGKPVVLEKHRDWPFSAAFNAEGTRVVTASDKTARVWNADGSGKPTVLRGHTALVRGALFNTEGSKIVTASDDGTARIYNADGSGKPVVLPAGDGARVVSAVFSPDGTQIVTAAEYAEYGSVRVWSVDGTLLADLPHGSWPVLRSAAWSADGTQILTVTPDAAWVWNVGLRSGAGPDGRTPGEPVVLPGYRQQYEGHRQQYEVASAAFNAAGTQVVVASEDGTVQVWNVDGTGEVVLKGHADGVLSAVFSPDGTQILTASYETARLWNADGSGQPIVLRGFGCAAFSPDGTRVVTASLDGTAKVWLIEPGRLKTAIRAVISACLDPEFRTLYLGESPAVAREESEECKKRQKRRLPRGASKP